MPIEIIQNYIVQYGLWMLALLVAIEYLGIPGYPGGVTLPVIGIMSRLGLLKPQVGIMIAMAASSVSISAVYIVGFKFSSWSTAKLAGNEKFSKAYAYMRELTDKYGAVSIFAMRLVPMVRTFASMGAGILGMNWRSYLIYSVAGNFVYTLGAVGLGYFATSLFV
ncbi:MAG: VTT domain-containing protein [Angelakisella sp.]